MTSPPLSEGPSPEALTAAQKLSEERCPHLKIKAIHGRGLQYVRATSCDQCVALALDEAKRSAHLEDARAMTAAASALQACIQSHSLRCAASMCHDHRMFRELLAAVKILDDAIARPEVWDALSLPPGGK